MLPVVRSICVSCPTYNETGDDKERVGSGARTLTGIVAAAATATGGIEFTIRIAERFTSGLSLFRVGGLVLCTAR